MSDRKSRAGSQTAAKPEPADAELSKLDLFDPAQATAPDSTLISASDLKSTVGAFAVRMQRRKKERAEQVDTAGHQAKLRQQLLLESMVKIRRSLEEVVRIDLGDRFRLTLQKDDLHGWPRLAIRLVDRLKPVAEYPIFRILSHDRQNRAAVEITYLEEGPPEILSLAKEADFKRLPTTLKKCVREYLDKIGEIVLKSEHADGPDDDDRAIAADRDLVAKDEPRPPVAGDEVDFFDDAYAYQDGFEKLPELEETETLDLQLREIE